MTKLREQCLSVLPGNTKTGKCNGTKKKNKLKAVKFHKRRTDSRKKKKKQNKNQTDRGHRTCRC